MDKRNLRHYLTLAQQDARGASMLEASIGMMVFLTFSLALIDLGRYFFVSVILNHAAQSAAELASRLNIEIDTSNCEGRPQDCTLYLNNLQRILNKAEQTARLAAAAPNTGGTSLVDFEMYYDAPQNVPALQDGDRARRSAVAFVRPGEKVRAYIPITEDFTEIRTYEHPTRPFRRDAQDSGPAGWPKVGENWSDILSKIPVEVIIAARFTPLTPFFQPMVIESRELSYRRPKDFGVRPPEVTLPGAATRTPTNTPNSSDPTAEPTNTPRSKPTISPTRIPVTPTPDATSTAVAPTSTPSMTPTPAASSTPEATPIPTIVAPTNTPTPNGAGVDYSDPERDAV